MFHTAQSDTTSTKPALLISVWSEDMVWLAECPPLWGYGQGRTPSEAASDLREVWREVRERNRMK